MGAYQVANPLTTAPLSPSVPFPHTTKAMTVATTEELAELYGMPTLDTTREALVAFLGDERARRLSAAKGYTERRWATICLAVYLGQTLTAASRVAGVHRRRLYEWFEMFPGREDAESSDYEPSLRDHLDAYRDQGDGRIAAQVIAFANSGEDPRHTQWVAERRLEAYRPPPKQTELEVKGPSGVRVVLERGDGRVVPPPAPTDDDADGNP